MSNKNNQQEITEEEIKEIDKDFKELLKVRNFDDFWHVAERLLAGSHAWLRTEELLANKKVKNFALEFFRNMSKKSAEIFESEEEEEGESVRFLPKKIFECLQNGNYLDFVELILILIFRYIADSGGVEEPDNIFDPDIEKKVLPLIPDLLVFPVTILSSLAANYKNSEKILCNLSSEQEDRIAALMMSILFETIEVLEIESDFSMVNHKRKKQIDEFRDSPHEVMDKYYDLMESDLTAKQAVKGFSQIIEDDPDFFDSYLELADIFLTEGNYADARFVLRAAFLNAMMKIVDYKGRWPKSMAWSWLENRHIIRALNRWAYFLWEEGRPEYAIEIFRRLLKSNPNDNIGARYSILAILMNYSSDWEEEMFPSSREGFIDAKKEMEWFSKNVKNFPEEFDWWLEEVEE